MGNHLMSEEVGMYFLGDPGLLAILLHDLLDATRGKWCTPLRLEEVMVLGMSFQMTS